MRTEGSTARPHSNQQPVLADRPDRSFVLHFAHGDGRTHPRSAADDVGADDRVTTSASHPFYARLHQLLRDSGFDDFVEARCATFYAATMGRRGLAPGIIAGRGPAAADSGNRHSYHGLLGGRGNNPAPRGKFPWLPTEQRAC